MKKIICSALLFASIVTFAQNRTSDVRPFRIGIKMGVPNVASFEFEYLTPLLDNRIAPFVNYTSAGFIIDQVDASVAVFEVGSNIYFSENNEGRGLYGTLSYQNINANLEIEDYEAEDGTLYEGNARTSISYSGLNVKVGAKLGRKFFFRTEFGYSFGAIPTEVFVEGNFEGEPISEIASVENEVEDFPAIFKGGLPIFNIGFGLSF